jgi:hypothetical protein
MSTLNYLDEGGTVKFQFVPWKLLNEWLSQLNGNPHVTAVKKEGINRGHVLEELEARRKTNDGVGSRALSLVGLDRGNGKDWRECENEQGYTHLEELLIYQPEDWRKQAREYMFRFGCDLSRESSSFDKRETTIQLELEDDMEEMTITMATPILVVLFHPDIKRTYRYEPLNLLLAYGVKNPVSSISLEPRLSAAFHDAMSPLDFFFAFQERVQSYRTEQLREIGCTYKCPRLSLIKELDFGNIIGQRLAKHMIRQSVVQHVWNRDERKRQLCSKRQPLSMIFAGPSGSGKTELAEWLASLLNKPGDDAFIKVDCAQLSDSGEMFGMAGCYQGAHEGSALNNFILRMSMQPDALGIVLFDEIEKAKQDVIHGLYQVIDKGEWTNKKLVSGTKSQTTMIPCHNLILIFTTNAANRIIADFDQNYQTAATTRGELDVVCSEIERLTRLTLQHTYPFTEAFIGRVGKVVPFFHLADGDLKNDVIRGEAMTAAKLLIEREQEKLDGDGKFGVSQLVTAATKHSMATIVVNGAIKQAGVRSIQQRVETEMGRRMKHSLLLEEDGLNSGAHVTYSARLEDWAIDYRVETSGSRAQNPGEGWSDDTDLYS